MDKYQRDPLKFYHFWSSVEQMVSELNLCEIGFRGKYERNEENERYKNAMGKNRKRKAPFPLREPGLVGGSHRQCGDQEK
ncbi:hypothetical protein AL543_20275 [Vibrio mimicus]|nr:hypothetical protein AL543_20275 [Vibrio mimicus]KAA3491920.1 hypothetical protein Y058_13200 [Vibrio mimicus]